MARLEELEDRSVYIIRKQLLAQKGYTGVIVGA